MLDFDSTYGEYLFQEFHIFLKENGTLEDTNDISAWSTEQRLSFLHEYIHYFQNIGTIFGLNLFYLVFDNNRRIRSTLEKDVKIPLPLKSSLYNPKYIIWGLTYGDNTEVKKVISYREESIEKIAGVVKARCTNNADEEVEITFGSHHIYEGMACLIHESIYPEAKGVPPCNPYYLALELADLIVPGISTNKFTMVALLDCSLISTNPAFTFIKFLEKIKDEGYDCNSITFDEIYNDMWLLPHDYYLYVRNFLNRIDEIFKYCNSEDRAREWFQGIVKRSMNIRMEHPKIFVDLMQGGDIINNDTFMYLLKELGTPIVKNGNKDYCFLRPRDIAFSKDDLISFYAMQQINRVFYSKGRFCCPLIDYCKKKLSAYVDERCETFPWKQPKRYRECLFSDCWERLGFKDVRITGEESD